MIQGYLPANFLDIRIRCARCGAVTATPGLAEGEVLHRSATAVPPAQFPAITSSQVPLGAVLVCQDALAQSYARTRPREVPDAPVVLTRALIEAAAADYDRLTNGRFADHAAASPPAMGADHGPFPLAWAVARLRAQIGRPEWSWLHQDDDAMAAMYVAAMHHLMQCWGDHPLLPRLAVSFAEPDRFIRTVAAFALAKLLYDAGNRVTFSPSGGAIDLGFTTPDDDPLSLALLAPEALQWPQRAQRRPDVARAAVIDALAAAQGRVNRPRPGIVVLASSILQPDFDQMVVDAIHAAFQQVGRRHRGVAAVAIIMPKVLPAGLPDRLGFGYAFYPIRNPRFFGDNPVRLDPAL